MPVLLCHHRVPQREARQLQNLRNLCEPPQKNTQLNLQVHSKPQAGVSAIRKSQGHSQVITPMEASGLGGKSLLEEIEEAPGLPSGMVAPNF